MDKGRAVNLAARVVNSNLFVDVVLGSCFLALGLRSWSQQHYVDALRTEKDALTRSNKALKKFIWESKQTLYADASSPETAIVPLSKLKAIYGEAVPVPPGQDAEKERKTVKLLI